MDALCGYHNLDVFKEFLKNVLVYGLDPFNTSKILEAL